MGDRVRELIDEKRLCGECVNKLNELRGMRHDLNELREMRHEVLTTWDIDSVRAITAKIKEIRADNPDGRGIEAVRLAYKLVNGQRKASEKE